MPAVNWRFKTGLWITAILASQSIFAASPWPGESSDSALKLTSLDSEFEGNMSGAYWNATQRTFWVCCNNPGAFWALQQDAAGNWQIAANGNGTPARWIVDGDLEGICQVNDSSSSVFVMDEDGWIRQYSTANYGVENLIRSWDIRDYCPEDGGDGAEGITFVPDDWLRHEGFRDNNGALRSSSNGMGGLMFVGSQIGGYVHVFDLNPNASTYTYCGSNQTSRAETADLAFDRISGKLYIWHNTGPNYLEVAELNSTLDEGIRRFRTLIEYTGPRSGNLEGFAIVTTADTNDWCLVTDDSNKDDEGVVLYQQFRPNEDADDDALSDDWELRYFGSTVISDGNADSDGDGQSDLAEWRAGTNPTNTLSVLRMHSVDRDGANVSIRWQTVGGRTNVVQVASSLTAAFSDLSPPIIIPSNGDVIATYLDSVNDTNPEPRFYRVRVEP